jgi:hypothetical protein
MNILLESGKRSNGMVVIPNRTKIPVIALAAFVFARSVLVSTAGPQPMSPLQFSKYFLTSEMGLLAQAPSAMR